MAPIAYQEEFLGEKARARDRPQWAKAVGEKGGEGEGLGTLDLRADNDCY